MPKGAQAVEKACHCKPVRRLAWQSVIYAGGARGGKARLESDQMSRKALPCKACVEHPKGTCFAARSDYFRVARRHKNNDILSGCRKSPSLAWESASPVPCLSLWERWPSAARTERANKEGPPPGGPSFMQFLQRFSTSRTPRQYPYRRRCTGWPGPSWPRAASASRAAG